MGRSVSTPNHALNVAFTHFHVEPEECQCILSEGEQCECSASFEPDYQYEWEALTDDLENRICELFPSFDLHKGWAGREDRILARNSFVNFGVSEYCGCVSIWMALRGDLEDRLAPLAEAWANKVDKKFLAEFGTMRKIGTASNGETFFRAVA